MKKLFLFLLAFSFPFLGMTHSDENYQESDMLKNMQPGDKAAVLMVHFGTSYDDTRTTTIDAINAKVRKAFPELRFEEAYTSRMIIRILGKRGIVKRTPLDALLKLRGEGYTHIIVQSTNIIDGAEMESLRRDVAQVEQFFKEVRVGAPLLSSVWDNYAVARILAEKYAADGSGKGLRQHFMFVGHGTYMPSTATYSQMDYIFKSMGHENFHVATLEGFPSYDTALAQFENEKKVKGVTLVPFMFVAGDHARNDIAGEWKGSLEEAGYKVDVAMEGLGQIPGIQDIYISHIKFSLHHRAIGIMEKKAKYASEK